MKKLIQVSYQWNEAAFVHAQFLAVSSSPAARKFFRTILAIGWSIWLIGAIIFFATESHWFELFLPVFVGGAFVGFPWFVRKWAGKVYATRADRDLTVNWEISEDRIVAKTQPATNSTAWARIEKIIRVREGFLLYPKEEAFLWLPETAFHGTEEVGQFAELAQSKVKNYLQVV